MVDDPRSLYHLTLVSQLHGQQCQNGYWFREASMHTGPDDDALQCQQIIERFNSRIMAWIKQFANTEWHPIGLVCATMIPRFGPIAEAGYESGSGDQLNESLPSSIAAILSLRTGLGGRNRLGRSYYPGISEGDHSASRLTPDSLSRLQGIGDALLSGFGHTDPANLFHYGVYSHKLGDVPSTTLGEGKIITMAGFTPITQTIARGRLGTCRHRMLGHGS